MLYRAKNIILTDDGQELIKEERNREDGVTIVACYQGKMTFTHNGNVHTVERGDLMLLLPSFNTITYEVSDDFRCKILYAGKQGFESIAHECLLGEPQWFEKLTYLTQHPVIRMNEYQRSLLKQYYDLLVVYMEGVQDNYRTQIIASLTRAVMLEIMSYLDIIQDKIAIPAQELTQADILFGHYIDLLKSNILEHREVNWYADQLCITPKYLTMVCRKRTGRTASQWIAQLTMDKIVRTLQQTDLSIKEAAYACGFDDVSFFCQFVRKHSGMTPVALRAKR